MKTIKRNQIDPLYVIFEQHLMNLQIPDLDRKTFITNVIQDYFLYLNKMKITVPQSLEKVITEELMNQVRAMLVKKIYGFHTIQEFQKKIPKTIRTNVSQKYSKLTKFK